MAMSYPARCYLKEINSFQFYVCTRDSESQGHGTIVPSESSVEYRHIYLRLSALKSK